jgi:hypothetical protein
MSLRLAAVLVAALAAASACDAGLEPEPVCARGLIGVCGTARFTGTPPAGTEAVYIIAFPSYPQSCSDLLTFPPRFRPFPPVPLPQPYVDSAAYGIAVPADRYEWLVAVWKKPGTPTFTVNDTALFRVAGEYPDSTNPAQPGVVTVPAGSAVPYIDVVVAFDNLRPVTDFVTCP